MDAVDVADLIENLRVVGNDHARVEAKRAKGGPPSRLWETVSAFANAQGGVMLFGVDEASDFAITGVDDPATLERHLGSLCSTNMEPPCRAIIETVTLEGRQVVVAEIPAVARSERPCYYRGEGPYGGSYVRVADGDRRLTHYEVSVLLADRGQPKDDERPIEEASSSDLNPDLTAEYLRLLRRDKPRMFSGGDQDALRMSKVLVPNKSKDGLVPSVAGILALGQYPQEFLPQVDLTFVVYPNIERGEPGPNGARFLDNIPFDGPISAITDDAIARLRMRMARRSIISGVARRDVYEYPEEAVREALVNALAHRDLSAGALGAQVQMEMFPDRLEIRNPGGLHGPVSAEDLLSNSTSSARNAALYKILEYVPLPDGRGAVCENRGSGIKAMVAALRAAGMSLPQFQDDIASFRVTFPNAALLDDATVAWLASLGQSGLTDSQVLALARMRHGQVMRNAAYRQETGVDSRVATAELRDLVARGIVVGEGQRGSTTYQLSAPTQLSATDTTDQSTKVAAPATHDRPTVPTIAQDVWDALESGPRSRRELEEQLGMKGHSVGYRLRILRRLDLVILIGEATSPNGRWVRNTTP